MWEQSDIDKLHPCEKGGRCIRVGDGVYYHDNPIHSYYKVRRFQKVRRFLGKNWLIDDYIVGQWDDILAWLEAGHGSFGTLWKPKRPQVVPGSTEFKFDMRKFC